LYQHVPRFALDVFRLCAWLMLLMAIFVPLEKRCALHPQKVFRRAFSTDLAYYFLSSLLPKLLLILPMTLIAWAVHHVQPSGMYAWVAGVPLWARFPAAMVVGEVG